MARQLMVDTYDVHFYTQLQRSKDATLASIAAKAIKESRYHLRRSSDWILRLGDGTDESHERSQRAFNELWSYYPEMFEMTADEEALAAADIAVDRSSMASGWLDDVSAVLTRATLDIPTQSNRIGGGRDGIHSENLGFLLAEMQFLQRSYPGLQW